ncbi:predicted protein [Naegleria gruberi]|uniref:Predicted protein n=1 Tax=Naegleria gruberi TaxID=5762 RepID=D2V6S2_NAEGR|nr:uncharacterized protein NAEGRDRAFT_31587 [Naegleria gruberi]EFC47492.1 predicted protein [Naegleria gruberi]|eukprot:XP_002680236.1 predicted protein [Naegleria gruberi strain NEG-M]
MLVIWANKQDLPNAVVDVDELTKILQLNSIKQTSYIQPCSAVRGTGLYEGLEWISNNL